MPEDRFVQQAPVIANTRLPKGSTNNAKGAHRFVAVALITAKTCGATGTLVLRADSAFYSSEVIAAVGRARGVLLDRRPAPFPRPPSDGSAVAPGASAITRRWIRA